MSSTIKAIAELLSNLLRAFLGFFIYNSGGKSERLRNEKKANKKADKANDARNSINHSADSVHNDPNNLD